MKQQLRVIVEEPIVDNEIEPFQNVKRLYRSCLNTEEINALDSAPVLAVFANMGGWPVVVGETWIADTWTWQQAVADARASGYSVNNFLSFSVSTDNKETTKRIIRVRSLNFKCQREIIYDSTYKSQIDQAALGLDREYLIEELEDPFVIAYHSYQVDLAVLFGAQEDIAAIEMREVLDFEIQLATVTRQLDLFH